MLFFTIKEEWQFPTLLTDPVMRNYQHARAAKDIMFYFNINYTAGVRISTAMCFPLYHFVNGNKKI